MATRGERPQWQGVEDFLLRKAMEGGGEGKVVKSGEFRSPRELSIFLPISRGCRTEI